LNPLEAALDEVGTAAIDGGGGRISKLEGRAVRGELTGGFLVSMEPDKCYAVAGLGADTITGIDLLVSAPSGAWVARTDAPMKAPLLRFCAKQAGPYRVAVTFSGRGEYLIGVYGPKPVPSASAVVSSPSAPPPAVSSAPVVVAPVAACESMGASEPFQRLVSGGERRCARDEDCISVKVDCSHLRCAGINRAYRGSYSAPLDCRGYRGVVGNYDCDPQFGIEAPRCREGCCVSERVEKRQ
jgi:hypothetical protein